MAHHGHTATNAKWLGCTGSRCIRGSGVPRSAKLPAPAAGEITQQSRAIHTTTKLGETMNNDILGLIQILIGSLINFGSTNELS